MGKRSLYFRAAVVALLLVAMSGYYGWAAYDAIVNQAIDPQESNEINTYTTSKTVQAARGDITDRYGNVLVTNRAEYVVTLDVDAMGSEENQAAVVQRLIEICKELGVEWNDEELPVSDSTPYSYTTDGNAYLTRDDDGNLTQTRLYLLCQAVRGTSDSIFWGDNTTSADELLSNMAEYFQLDQLGDLSSSEQREILGVLYSAYLRSEEVTYSSYYFAEDVDIDFITMVEEEGLAGVNIEALSVREYQTSYAAHLLGQVGAITAEKWAELSADEENTYNMNDSIGLSGVESAFEEYLKGVDGTLQLTYDNDGVLVDETYTTEPQSGNTVALTLDSGLQEVAENALAEYTEQINSLNGGSAVVVISVEDSSVLAMASYPTYDPATYNEDYEELADDDLLPLYNRALLGTYAPGSTYKICTATAAVNAGVTDTTRTVNCTGTYNNSGTIQTCWRKSGHGLENLSAAIRDSCNIYFYTMGTEIGISYLTETAQAYGLGVASGIELTESTGVNAGPDYSESVGAIWYQGNVTSAAIGQSDNQFTLLQIANYIATFVRGGDRYDAHLLSSVKSSDNTEILYEHETEILSTVELSDAAREAIIEGMGEVIEADDITDFEELEASGVKVGCKTGTAQINNNSATNGLFVAFAPIDDPEIVVCSVVEKADAGADTVAIAAAIMNYYFSDEATLERVEAENQLLQ
ncbi:MAG: penicillin-binding protein A [Clostridiales bacterium]|nr:penicillin-binding protein A [Clostridiales bacterium]